MFEDSAVWMSGGSSHQLHLGFRPVKRFDAGLPCTLTDGGIGRAVLEDRRERGAIWGVIRGLR